MIGYETVFITHPDLEEADLKKSLKKFKDIIKKGKGKLIHEYLWGRRRLAYQIANQNHGVYHIWYLQGTGAILDELQTQFRYSDEVLRFQTVKVDDLDQEAGFFSEMLKAQQELHLRKRKRQRMQPQNLLKKVQKKIKPLINPKRQRLKIQKHNHTHLFRENLWHEKRKN